MKIYDMMTFLREETADNLEVFDEMLNMYGVDHIFMELTEEEMDKNDEYVLKVVYLSEAEMTFDLVVLLFAKTVLNRTDEQIKTAMKKMAA